MTIISQYRIMEAFRASLDVTGGVPDAITTAIADTLAASSIEVNPPVLSYAGANEIGITDANYTPAVFWTLKGASEAWQYATGGRQFDTVVRVDIVTHRATTMADGTVLGQTENASVSVLYMDMIRRALFSKDGIPSVSGCSIANISILDIVLDDYFVDGIDTEYGHQVSLFIGISNEDEGYN